MSDPIRVDAAVEGMNELRDKFAQMATLAQRDNLEVAGRAGALPVQNAAKELAPKRTRNLSRSIHTEVVFVGEQMEVYIGTDLEYAAIQELGGVITPKEAKYLAIPLTDAARQFVSPRNFGGGELSFRPTSGGGGLLVDKNGEAHYRLVKAVTIPAKPFLRPALEQNITAAFDDMAATLKSILARVTGVSE